MLQLNTIPSYVVRAHSASKKIQYFVLVWATMYLVFTSLFVESAAAATDSKEQEILDTIKLLENQLASNNSPDYWFAFCFYYFIYNGR